MWWIISSLYYGWLCLLNAQRSAPKHVNWMQCPGHLFPSRKHSLKSSPDPYLLPKSWDSVQVSVHICSESSIQSLWNICKVNSAGHSHGRAGASYMGLLNQSRQSARQVNRKPGRTVRQVPAFCDFTFTFYRTYTAERVSFLGLKKMVRKKWPGGVTSGSVQGGWNAPKCPKSSTQGRQTWHRAMAEQCLSEAAAGKQVRHSSMSQTSWH